MRTKIFIAAVFFLSVFVISLHAQTETESGATEINEDNIIINIYGGYYVNYWYIVPSIFNELSYKNDPYKIKQIGLKTDFSNLSFGIEYSDNDFSFTSNIASEGSTSKNKTDQIAETLKLFNGISFGRFSLQTTFAHQEYSTIATSMESDIINYYPDHGNMIMLNKNDTITWDTDYTKIMLEIDYTTSESNGFGIGVRYAEFGGPTETELSSTNPMDMDSGDIIIFTKNKIYDLYFSGNIKQWFSNQVYTMLSVSGSIVTAYYPESRYFDIEYKNPLSLNSFSVSGVYSGAYSLHINGSNFRIETGAQYEYYASNLSYKKVKLKKDIAARDRGSEIIFYKGEKVDLDFSRHELFWGLYLKASILF